MAGQIGGGDEDMIAAINITPMVDVMLVLLIIFMITASIVDPDSIKIELPEAATGEPTETTTLGLTIDPEGNWYLNATPITEDALRAFIRSEKAQDKELQAAVAADQSRPYGDVIELIDVIKQEGVLKFALNIDTVSLPANAPPPTAPSVPTE
jgi:biopolymer transport protein ExbD